MKKELAKAHISTLITSFIWILIGACIAAFSITIFFLPNRLIDGGTVGIAMIVGRLVGVAWIPVLAFIFALPFIILAIRHIGKLFVLHVGVALVSFAIALHFMPYFFSTPFQGESLEVVVIGGGILGIGVGLIIRKGGCLDGTEILGIIFNRIFGFTVGQVVLFCNICIFTAAGLVFHEWHPPIMSLIAFIVVAKTMDVVLIGFDETKSVLVISHKYKEIEAAILHKLGLGLTVMYGRGGFSGESREIIYIIVERLQLAELKEVIYSIDPHAFVAIESLHEVSTGRNKEKPYRRSTAKLRTIYRRLFQN
jgi:uncharacterized membrane-anchored protein YitT (DUF2179 family)